MSNAIEKVPVIQSELDKIAIQDLTSGWMDLNSNLVKYTGGNEIKIPEMTMDGLGDYDRENGFVDGSINLKWKTYEMTQDRGRSFSFDENEVDESNFVVTASSVIGEFQRTKVAPEVDSFRYSKIASVAIENERARFGYTPSADDILSELYKDIEKVADIYGEDNIVITMNRKVATLLDTSKELSRHINVGDFAKGDVTLKVKTLDGQYPIIRVSSDRLKTAYEFLNGKDGQEAGGFKPSPTAKDINWIISTKKAPIAVNKTDKMRAFDPETNQKARAWKIDYRKYHDLWIPKNKVDGIFVNIKQSK
ncbi:MAG: hypothetical protein KGV43_02435 [Arcobacter sp.]|nr:hypothetical protein [Arcobacter sp.]